MLFNKRGGVNIAKSKSTYWRTKAGLEQIESWASEGLTDKEMSKKMGIGRTTFYDYIKKYPNISDSLKKGKKLIDCKVEQKLFNKCMGTKTTKVIKELNKDTGELVITKEITEEVAPDTTAIIYWLKNRKPEMWKDKQTLEHTGSVEVNPYSQLTVEELRKLANKKDDDW